jgi:hypothetical protein
MFADKLEYIRLGCISERNGSLQSSGTPITGGTSLDLLQWCSNLYASRQVEARQWVWKEMRLLQDPACAGLHVFFQQWATNSTRSKEPVVSRWIHETSDPETRNNASSSPYGNLQASHELYRCEVFFRVPF